MVSSKSLLDRLRSTCCKSAQMGPYRLSCLWMWPTADNEPYSPHMSINMKADCNHSMTMTLTTMHSAGIHILQPLHDHDVDDDALSWYTHLVKHHSQNEQASTPHNRNVCLRHYNDHTFLHAGHWPLTFNPENRDVTKFEFEFDNVLMFSTDSKFDECFKRVVVKCEFLENPCSTTDFICTESQRMQKNLFFFFQIQPITTTVIECATKFLLSDVLQCTNINTDFTDFRK